MDDVFDTLRHAVGAFSANAARGEHYLDGFRAERPSQAAQTRAACAYPQALVLRAAQRLFTEQGLDVGKGIDPERHLVRGRIKRDLTGTPWIAAFTSMRRDWLLTFEATVTVASNGDVTLTTSRSLPAWSDRFVVLLSEVLARTEPEALRRAWLLQNSQAASGPTVLGPGEALTKPFRGTLRDYSGCATAREVADLTAASGGRLPLGRQLFVKGDGAIDKGPELFLGPNRHTGALREHQSMLICAPQGSGKTELLVRWARAANAAGYNLFIVDVKGNMFRRLNADGKWQGKVCHFTTDPRRTPGDGQTPPCHAANILERIDPWSRVGTQQIRQLAEALLPADGLNEGEMKVYRANWINWLATFIHLALVDERYTPFDDRRVDLGDVYELASDESALIACIQRIAAAEAVNLAEGRLPPVRLRELFNEIAVLLPPEEIVPALTVPASGGRTAPAALASKSGAAGALPPPRELSGSRPALVGQRAEHTFRWLTENLLAVLRPFGSHGLLGDKTSGAHGLPRFSFEDVAGLDAELAPAGGQVTVLLSAREQEGEEANTILSVIMARLQQALLERMRHSGDKAMRPVLLLLDETRRIRNFKPNEYISFARQAEAGCVIVYQSLEQVGEERQVAELLENVGTQVYLGSLVRSTARHFIESLPKRHRPTFTLTSAGADGFGAVQSGQEAIDYFSTADLYVLPAGDFPALIHLNDQPRRSPILVSLDRKHSGG
jgi:hypothetical protein